MRRALFFLAVFAAIGGGWFSPFLLASEEGILAVVNNEIITYLDMRNYLEGLKYRLARRYQGKALEEAYARDKKTALADLIGDTLIVQEAKKEKMQIPAEIIEAKFEQFKKSFPTTAEFEQYLRQNGLTIENIKEKIRRQLLIKEFITKKIRPTIEIRPSEITAYYQSHIEEFKRPKEVDYDSLRFGDLASAQAALEKAKKEGFSAVKKEYSDNLLSGTINIRQCRRELLELFSLPEESFSPVIKIEDSYFIFFIKKIIPAKTISLKEAQGAIWNLIYQEKLSQRLNEVVSELKKKAVIKIYAPQNYNN